MSTTHDEHKTVPNMDILQAAAFASSTAREKGWLDRPRTAHDVFSLFHSELSEALEAYRDGDTSRVAVISEDGKPEGVAVELADFVIRVLEWCETECHQGILMGIVAGHSFPDDSVPFPRCIAELHAAVGCAYMAWDDRDEGKMAEFLTLCVLRTFWYCQREKIDLVGAINVKQQYNTTRMQRHGGKVI